MCDISRRLRRELGGKQDTGCRGEASGRLRWRIMSTRAIRLSRRETFGRDANLHVMFVDMCAVRSKDSQLELIHGCRLVPALIATELPRGGRRE